MVQVINGQVMQDVLPQSGILSDGRSVSNYDLLPLNTLKTEGWLPCEENKPVYDKLTQYLVIDNYEVLSDKVIVNFKVVNEQ
jgi:hypothetical protein